MNSGLARLNMRFEESAGVILQILERTEIRRIGEPSNRDERFNEELLRLLADPDIKVVF